MNIWKRARRVSGSIARWAAILLLAAVFGFPLYWVVTTAFKPGEEWNPPGKVYWFPQHPTLENFETALGLRGAPVTAFLAQPTRSATGPLKNSLIAASAGTALALAVGTLAGYGVARFRAGGRHFPFLALLIRMFPPIVILIPLFFIWFELGLVDTLQGLVILYGAFTFPFALWMMRSFFLEVPHEISEAAICDGCTHWGAFFKAVLPQVKGALLATALFVFILNWSDLLIAQVISGANKSTMTAPVFLARLQSDEFERQYGPQAALSLLLLLPPAVFGLAIRNHLVRGLAFGALRR